MKKIIYLIFLFFLIFGVSQVYAGCGGQYKCVQYLTTGPGTGYCGDYQFWSQGCNGGPPTCEPVLPACSGCLLGGCYCNSNWPGCTTACGTAGYYQTDGCGNYSWCPPTASCCNPDCSCAANTCVGQTCPNGCGGNCDGTKVDESQTNCTGTQVQYTETPQTTGTIWARATGCTSGVTSAAFPTWNSYNGQDDIVWYPGANQGGGTWQSTFNISSHQPALGSTINVHVYENGVCRPAGSGWEGVGGQTVALAPKTCAVTINTSGAVSSQASGINITATGNAHINPGSDTVRVWITRNDMGDIPGGVTYDYGGSTGIVAVNNGSNYYSIANAYQNSVNSANTSATFTVHAPAGNYRVHCDLPNDLNGNLVKCSGNPTCNYNGGANACVGWKDCSSNDWAPFRIVSPPTFTSLVIKNADSGVVAGEAGGTTFRNHICQTTFQNTINPPRRVIFEASVNDIDGAADITTATLTWKGNNYPMTKISSAGTAATMQATINFVDSDNATGLFDLFVTATDSNGASSGLVNTDRDWKVWDCQVPTYGSLYEAKDGVPTCSTTSDGSYIDANKIESGVGFNSIIFSDTPNVTMNDNDLNSYGPNSIVWGKMYLPLINGGTAGGNFDGTLLATGRRTRIVDMGLGTTTCPNSQFTINNANISAYSASPQAKIDFSFIQDQEAWYQVVGAGVKGKEEVESGVPVTALEQALTLSTVNNINGLVSSKVFKNNINGCSESTCVWGNPNNWYLKQNTNDLDIYNYNYFYNNFYVKAGLGEIKTNSWGGWATDNIYFINDNLDINEDLIVPSDQTMMVIVNGDITIALNVTRLDGIYIANGNIGAGGDNSTALTINGMLYARGSVRLNRSFIDKRINNTTPAVKVNYSPRLIFNLDPKVLQVLSGWREE